MALIESRKENFEPGQIGIQRVLVDFDNNYETGGEAFDPDKYHKGRTVDVHIKPQDGYVFEWDATNKKIIARVSGTTDAPLNEEGNATDMSTITGVEVRVWYAQF